jgi:hypothetical protein
MGTIADFNAEEKTPEETSSETKEQNDFYKYITPPGQEK